MKKDPGRPETMLVRFEGALSPMDILSMPQMVLGAQNYILANYERTLRGPKIFWASEKNLVPPTRFFGIYKGPGLPKSWILNRLGLPPGDLSV